MAGRPASPVQAAGCRLFELDDEVVQLHGPTPGVGVDRDTGRHRVGQPKVVRRSHAIYQQPQLIPTGDGIDDRAIVRSGWPFGKSVNSWLVIQPPINTPKFTVADQALQRFINGVPVAKCCKVRRHPDSAYCIGSDE
jgi:hypothetical protein